MEWREWRGAIASLSIANQSNCMQTLLLSLPTATNHQTSNQQTHHGTPTSPP
jgi:hypothetical protein